jgi:hypothetical protein
VGERVRVSSSTILLTSLRRVLLPVYGCSGKPRGSVRVRALAGGIISHILRELLELPFGFGVLLLPMTLQRLSLPGTFGS